GLVSRTWSRPASPPSAAVLTVKSGCSLSRAARPSRTSRLSSITNTRILFATNQPPTLGHDAPDKVTVQEGIAHIGKITRGCRENPDTLLRSVLRAACYGCAITRSR